MKKIFGILIVISMISTAFAPRYRNETAKYLLKDEIEFKNSNFDEALKEAKKTGKIIFLDAYTEWCGPCKKMAATTFKDAEVAKVFNAKFINLKVEMEKDADGPRIAQQFSVRAYPSLLFINGDGKIVKYVVGFQTAEQLLAIANSL